jgi:hypothetical protein
MAISSGSAASVMVPAAASVLPSPQARDAIASTAPWPATTHASGQDPETATSARPAPAGRGSSPSTARSMKRRRPGSTHAKISPSISPAAASTIAAIGRSRSTTRVGVAQEAIR